jgi:hypothetical protein
MRLNTQHWNFRADHARITARWIGDAEAKRLLAEIAERYERIAEIANVKALGFIPSPKVSG